MIDFFKNQIEKSESLRPYGHRDLHPVPSTRDGMCRSTPTLSRSGFRHIKFFKFIFSGGISALTTLALLYIFTNFLHIWYLASSVMAFSLAIILNFSLQKFWAFKGNQKKRAHWQFFLFLAINFFNLGVNSGGMYVLVDKLGFWYMLAQIIMLAILAFVSFLFYKLVIFKEIEY